MCIVLDGKPINFPKPHVWKSCIISIAANLNFDTELREIFKIYWKTFCTKLSHTEWLKEGRGKKVLLSKDWANHKKKDKQKIWETLAFHLQLALHERLVTARLLKLWHDPSSLCPLETLTKLWEYRDVAPGVTCKTIAEDESLCLYKLPRCSSSSIWKKEVSW